MVVIQASDSSIAIKCEQFQYLVVNRATIWCTPGCMKLVFAVTKLPCPASVFLKLVLQTCRGHNLDFEVYHLCDFHHQDQSLPFSFQAQHVGPLPRSLSPPRAVWPPQLRLTKSTRFSPKNVEWRTRTAGERKGFPWFGRLVM